jgi:cell fate regulator YaaT (PSP1 superfamily)
MAKNSNLVEVAFKRERKQIFRDRQELDIRKGEYVVVEAERGTDFGKVSLAGGLVRLKRGKGETRSTVRKATPADMEQHEKNKQREQDAFEACRTRIGEFHLDMKLVDVEMQFDGSKITFYFTAAQRVDFRELVKSLAAQYRTRIELRQIGVRDEARRIGGCGICGRQQCCSGFLNEFEQITTQMAKEQQLALNPAKISGNCGRLLCCLRYEVDIYTAALKQFPHLGAHVRVNDKKGVLSFVNVFDVRGQVQFEDKTMEWFGPDDISRGRTQEAPQAQEARTNDPVQ